MKKTLISVAVMGALVAPLANADIKLYGKADFQAKKGEHTDVDFGMDKTRLGVMGNVENGIEGVETFFQFEWDFAANNTPLASTSQGDVKVRKSLVGISSGLGTVIAGRQQNPLQAIEDTTDAFNTGDSDALHQIVDRIGKSLTYTTPSIAGFNAFAGVIAEHDASTQKVEKRHGDAYAYGVSFNGVEGLNITAGIQDVRPTTNPGGSTVARQHSRIGGVGVSYQIGDLTLGAMAQKKEFVTGAAGQAINTAGQKDVDVAGARVAYQLGAVKLQAAYTEMDDNGESAAARNKAKQGIVGAEYALGSQAATYIEYVAYDKDAVVNGQQKSDQVVVGYKISF